MTGASPGPELGLGIDAGGTRTRWALARADGSILKTGEAAGMGAVLVLHAEGRERVRATLQGIADEVLAAGRPARVQAGVTGLAEAHDAALREMISAPFGVAPGAITLESDIAFAYHGVFAPGEGYVIYAGTGSVAAFIDVAGTLHRAGGRGAMLDDAGAGFWIAKEALRRIWRREDELPGAWNDSPMARAMFERLGGSDWAITRAAVYGGDRGEMGKLALVVAESAEADPLAQEILKAAGAELARLGNAMTLRYGRRPVVLTGRASRLHPMIEEAMRKALLPNTELRVRDGEPHVAAARLAAKG